MPLLGGGDGGGVGNSPELGGIGSELNQFFCPDPYPLQLTQGIFTKVIQEIARVENSYGQERRCHLM